MKNKLLLIRFSALGDVAMVAHIIKYLKEQYPLIDIYILTKPQFADIFTPFNIKTITPEFKREHKGLIGLYKLAKNIGKDNIKKVADLHGVLRSFLLDFLLVLQGIKISIFKKNRIKKKLIIKGKKTEIIHTVERYANTIQRLGFDINLNGKRCDIKYSLNEEIKKIYIDKEKINIGIAPFAAHKNKEYPINLMEKVIELLFNENKFNVIIFGGGKREKLIAETWARKYNNVKSAINKLPIYQEIALIDQLQLIITMDSGNMHLASLTNTKNIIIWGSTHPRLGFTPYNNFDPSLSLIKNLKCQPCSIFGSEKCKRKDFACLYQILPSEILKKVKEIFNLNL